MDLTAGDLEALPERCRRCLFWEVGAQRPDEAHDDELAADPVVQKQAWWSSQQQDGGPPGRLVRSDGRVVGYAAFAPTTAYERRRPPVPRPSDDALFVATAWIDPAERGSGFGRLLVQSAIREALRRELRAVEAYGDRRHIDGACVLPCTWLLHEGFEVHREHPRYPLLRLDVRSASRWAESLEDAVEHVLGRLGRRVPADVREVSRASE